MMQLVWHLVKVFCVTRPWHLVRVFCVTCPLKLMIETKKGLIPRLSVFRVFWSTGLVMLSLGELEFIEEHGN